MLDFDDERDYAEEAFNQDLLDNPDPEPEPAAPVLKRDTRFRAYPGRQVRTWKSDGWITDPVYVVTATRKCGGDTLIYYRVDDGSGNTNGQSRVTLTRLQENGLEILP